MNIFTRRDILRIAGLTWLSSMFLTTGSSANAENKPSCVLTPKQTAGPFYFDVNSLRENITDGRKGVALKLSLKVVTANDCKPLKDVVVDIWHADAKGTYSGYKDRGVDTSGESFLRGMQVTDKEGMVNFKTIYPGSYPGRVPHIHFKAYTGDSNLVTSQLYFPSEISKDVYSNHPEYDKDRIKYLDESNDLVLRWYGGADKLRMKIEENNNGFTASHTIGIKI